MPKKEHLQSEDEAVLDEVLRRWIGDGCPKGQFLQYWSAVERDIAVGAFVPQRRSVTIHAVLRQ